MKIKDLFQRDIFRPINGVVKAEQLDESSVWQELDEFVVTRELDKHFRAFFNNYIDAIDNAGDSNVADKIGVWISGFFGSGKSHFLKVLSYLLANREHTNETETKHALEFFESKITDAMLLGEVKRAVVSNTDVVLFNIDSKADHSKGRDAILLVFLKVLNEMQGYSPDHPHIAHLERYLQSKGKLQEFHDAYKAATGTAWVAERDAYEFNRDQVVQALSETLGQSKESAEKWVDSAESNFALTVENFCKWVKGDLDAKGSNRRIIFFVDEVGQFIGADTHLMLSLQTITEDLGTICSGRAWVVVTSQEDIDAVLGEMKQSKANDFSKIQGRFRTRLSLSSSNADEVIQHRLLEKRDDVRDALSALFAEKGDILKNQLSFRDIGMTLSPYKDANDFITNYPFVPYQFKLLQKIFEAVRRVGATGLHLSRGERSMLDAFHLAVRNVADKELGVLVPLHQFYPSIESFLDTVVKKTIDQAADNASLQLPIDQQLLQTLFLIRYVDEVKGNVDNLVTLFLGEIDADKVVLRKNIEEGLARLENETLINRNGDAYQFLTNEERDISKEIKTVEVSAHDQSKMLGELVFEEALKGSRKHRYATNKMDFTFNRTCDLYPIGTKSDGVLSVSVVSPLFADYELYDKGKCTIESSNDNGQVLLKLRDDGKIEQEIRSYLQTEKYLRTRNDGSLSESTKRIHSDLSVENRARRQRLVQQVEAMIPEADCYVAGQALSLRATSPQATLTETMEYLIANTFTKMSYLKRLVEEPVKEIQAVLRANDVEQQQLALTSDEANPQGIADLREYIDLSTRMSKQIVLHELIENRYALRPFGWPPLETALLLARLIVLSEVHLVLDGAVVPFDKAYDVLTTTAKWRKTIIMHRRTADPKAIQDARVLGKEVFSEMGPDGEDALVGFLKKGLDDCQRKLLQFKSLADTGNYPGADEIDNGLTLVKALLVLDDSYKFIERFNDREGDLLGFATEFRELDHFYTHQRSMWDRLHKESNRFELNRLDLERDAAAALALRRIGEILAAPAPYELIMEGDGLIRTIETVNNALIVQHRNDAVAAIDGHIVKLTDDLDAIAADGTLRSQSLGGLTTLRASVATEGSIAHIAQKCQEALYVYDKAIKHINQSIPPATPDSDGQVGAVAEVKIKPQHVVVVSHIAKGKRIENAEDVETFITDLRQELEAAIGRGERIEIR